MNQPLQGKSYEASSFHYARFVPEVTLWFWGRLGEKIETRDRFQRHPLIDRFSLKIRLTLFSQRGTSTSLSQLNETQPLNLCY